jgi:SAM-dependent methyltransferase
MIRCPNCDARHETSAVACPQCSWSPRTIGGFTAWAPELSEGDTGLAGESFALIARYEDGHFWFESRNAVIVWALQRFFPSLRSLLEIGCGTGVVLSSIARAFPDASLVGSEVSASGLGFAAERVRRARLVQMDGRHIPFEDEFEVVTAFDVLEHIPEDEAVLKEMYRAARPGGGIVVSVPQHDWLWSAVDDYSRHQRRYERGELMQKIKTAGFQSVHVTSFMTLILPAMLLSRLNKRDVNAIDPAAELKVGRIANRALGALCAAERRLLTREWSLPIGGSLFAVARKA